MDNIFIFFIELLLIVAAFVTALWAASKYIPSTPEPMNIFRVVLLVIIVLAFLYFLFTVFGGIGLRYPNGIHN